MNDYKTVRVALVGSANSGKTSLVRMLAKENFISSYYPTIGVDIKFVYMHEQRIKLLLWDLAGDSRFEKITTPLLNSSDLILLCFDTRNSSSPHYISQIHRRFSRAFTDRKKILVCTKVDLCANNDFDLFGVDFSEKNDCDFIVTCAKTGQGREELLNSISKLSKELWADISSVFEKRKEEYVQVNYKKEKEESSYCTVS